MDVSKTGGRSGYIAPRTDDTLPVQRPAPRAPLRRTQSAPDLPRARLRDDARPVQNVAHGGSALHASPMFMAVARPQVAEVTIPEQRIGVPLLIDGRIPRELQQLVGRLGPLVDANATAGHRLAQVEARLRTLSDLDPRSPSQEREFERLGNEYGVLGARNSDTCHVTAEAVSAMLGANLDAPLTRNKDDRDGRAFAQTLRDNARDGKPHLYLLRASYEFSGHSWVVLQQGDTCLTFQSNARHHRLQDWMTGRMPIGDGEGRAACAKFGGLAPVPVEAYARSVTEAIGGGDLSGLVGCPKGEVRFGFEEHRIGPGPRDPNTVWDRAKDHRFYGWF